MKGLCHCTKNEVFPHFPADLITFNEEILNGKLHFLCSAFCESENLKNPILRYQNLLSAKCIKLGILRKLIEYSFKKILVINVTFTPTVFEILLFEGRERMS